MNKFTIEKKGVDNEISFRVVFVNCVRVELIYIYKEI